MKCLIEQGNPNGRLEIWLFIFLFHFFPFFCTFSDQDWHFPDFFFSSGKSEEANFKGTATSFNWNLCELGSIRRRFVFLFQQIWKKKEKWNRFQTWLIFYFFFFHIHKDEPPLQAPHEIVSLFHGSRQIIYGFVPNCSQASLEANLGRMVVSTLVFHDNFFIEKSETKEKIK